MNKEILIENIPIKTNGTIKKALDLYAQMNIKRFVLMRDYLAVLQYKDPLVNANNPWLYYRKGILNDNIEHGMTSNEKAFELGAISLHKTLKLKIKQRNLMILQKNLKAEVLNSRL